MKHTHNNEPIQNNYKSIHIFVNEKKLNRTLGSQSLQKKKNVFQRSGQNQNRTITYVVIDPINFSKLL